MKRYTPEEITQINRAAASQQEQVNRIQGRYESDLNQFEELKKQALKEFGVDSLDKLRAQYDRELAEINRQAENVASITQARQAVLDDLQQKVNQQEQPLNA